MKATLLPRRACCTLAKDEIHVWQLSLTLSSEQLDYLRELLSDDERERANRYMHRPSREQFITTRASLRMLLGRYLGMAPERIRLGTSNTGKPILVGGGLYFNVTHSQEVGMIGLSYAGEVGIDVERVRAYPGHLDMADRYFTPNEVVALKRLPIGAREHAFYHVWTRKEAFLKATGLGLSHGLERFEVSVPPDDPARILHIDGDHTAGERWCMTKLEPAEGYVGTLAIEAHGKRVRFHLFEDLD
jgi:4'-phosphopantetheinyl transferase